MSRVKVKPSSKLDLTIEATDYIKSIEEEEWVGCSKVTIHVERAELNLAKNIMEEVLPFGQAIKLTEHRTDLPVVYHKKVGEFFYMELYE